MVLLKIMKIYKYFVFSFQESIFCLLQLWLAVCSDSTENSSPTICTTEIQACDKPETL